MKALTPINVVDFGLVRRVRGVAYTTKMAPSVAARCVDAARGVLNKLLPDVFIYTDPYSGASAGLSPGYAVALTAESTTGCAIGAEAVGEGASLPEDLGRKAALALALEVGARGVIDSSFQSFVVTMMAFTPEDVSRVRVGALSEHCVATLRDLKTSVGVVFKVAPDVDNGGVVLSCLGVGYKNVNRTIS